jgi:hypothetical protein
MKCLIRCDREWKSRAWLAWLVFGDRVTMLGRFADAISSRKRAPERPTCYPESMVLITSSCSFLTEVIPSSPQVLLNRCPEVDPNVCQKYAPLRRCVAGQIYDSCPIDFLSEIGVRFLSHPPGGQQSAARFAAAKVAAIVLDGLFKGRFETQRRDFWHTLESAAVSNSQPWNP